MPRGRRRKLDDERRVTELDNLRRTESRGRLGSVAEVVEGTGVDDHQTLQGKGWIPPPWSPRDNPRRRSAVAEKGTHGGGVCRKSGQVQRCLKIHIFSFSKLFVQLLKPGSSPIWTTPNWFEWSLI